VPYLVQFEISLALEEIPQLRQRIAAVDAALEGANAGTSTSTSTSVDTGTGMSTSMEIDTGSGASGTGSLAPAGSLSVAVGAMVVEERADAARLMESIESFVERHTITGYAR
jgi:hypothetical protein